MDLTNIRALSFDCYGTLIDWEAGIAAVLAPWARSAGLDLDVEALLARYSAHEARAEAEHPTELYPMILARSFRDLGTELGLEVSAADALELGRSVPAWPAFDDSHDALVRLGVRFKLIVLSNVDHESFAGSRARLDVEFDRVLTAQDIGSYKPAQRNFDALLAEAARMGLGNGQLLHVAQSLFHDHGPAKIAGLPTVWINRRHDRPGWGATPPPPSAVSADWEFPSMAAFVDAVEAG